MTNAKARPAPWSAEENQAIVRLYFTMLDRATAGEAYNKAAMIRNEIDQPDAPNRLMTYPLADRSKGSVEAKLMNCSAAHRDVYHDRYDREPIDTMHNHGYRALSNYQASLAKAMEAELVRRNTYAETQPETWRDRAANRS